MTKKLGSLWQHKTKEGRTYFTGTIEVVIGQPLKIVALKNDKKNSDKSPDWNIVLSEPKKEGSNQNIKTIKIENKDDF